MECFGAQSLFTSEAKSRSEIRLSTKDTFALLQAMSSVCYHHPVVVYVLKYEDDYNPQQNHCVDSRLVYNI